MGDSSKVYESPDFLEELLRHLAICPVVMAKAKECGLTFEDFVVDDVIGSKIYREFSRILLMLGVAPVSSHLFLTYIKEALGEKKLDEDQVEDVAKLISYLFDDKTPLNSEFVANQLVNFIRYRRILKAQIVNKDDLDKLVVAYNEVNNTLSALETKSVIRSFNLFENLVLKEDRNDVVPTGMPPLDAIIGGHSKGELGYMVGYSGKGKTLLMTSMARGAAKFGHRVLILEMEEAGENISNRFYSSQFKIPYKDLFQNRDGVREELVEAYNGMKDEDRREVLNIQVDDLRDVEVTSTKLAQWLEERAKNTGFFPDVVFLDQLDFIYPNEKLHANRAKWERYDLVSQELYKLAQYKIMGRWGFALWCLHQATGDPQMLFSRSKISGYQGIIKPATIVMGIGADKKSPNVMSIFSEKARHVPYFNLNFQVDAVHQEVLGDQAVVISSNLVHTPPSSNPMRRTPEATPRPPVSNPIQLVT